MKYYISLAVLALITKSSAIKISNNKEELDTLDYDAEPNTEMMFIPEEGIYVGT